MLVEGPSRARVYVLKIAFICYALSGVYLLRTYFIYYTSGSGVYPLQPGFIRYAVLYLLKPYPISC
jgi:hypothetical protein